MSAHTVLRLTALCLVVIGLGLLVATGDIALALGTPGPAPENGAGDPAAMAFWRQLTFMRLFGTAAVGLGAICVWCGRHLTAPQQSSFLKVLVGVLGAMALMALSQQTAIWGTGAGWVLVGLLGAAGLTVLSVWATHARGHAV